MFKLCNYIKDDKHVCDAPAMRHQRFCYHHLEFLRRQRNSAKARQRMLCAILKDNPPNSLPAVQTVMERILEGMELGRLDKQQSRLMLSLLRLMAANIHNFPELGTPAALQALLAQHKPRKGRATPCG